MVNFLEFAILGLGAGAVYVLVAHGLVLIYRGSGVLNFAQANFAMVGAYTFYELHVQHSMPFAVAFFVAVLLGALIGCLVYLLIMRPLRHASPLSRLIATLGVLLILQGLATVRYKGTVVDVPSSLPSRTLHVGSLAIPEAQLYLLAIAVALTAVLDVTARRSTIGLSLSAVSENPRAAAAIGISPERLSLLTWSTGGVIAAAAGVLIAPLSGLSVSNFTFLIVTALAVGLVGGFTSFWLTLVGGVAFGILQSEATLYFSSVPGLTDALPFFVILIILVVRGRPLPVRGEVFDRLPIVGSGIVRPKLALTLAVILVVLILEVFPTNLTAAISLQLAVCVILLGVVVITGYAGQLSLAPFALAGVGAFFAGRLVAFSSWPLFPAMLVAVIGSALVGVLFSLPALRVRGVNLAIVTIGLGMAITGIVFSNSSFTGGGTGTVVGGARIFGINIDPIAYPDRYAIFSIIVLGLTGVSVANLRRGRVGRRLIAVRSNERAAASLGVGVTGAKVFAFAFSAAVSGLGGILLGFQAHSIVFTNFDSLTSIQAVAWATVGGIGLIPGAILGSGLVPGGVGSYILDKFGSLDQWLTVISGVTLIVILLQNPDGIAGAVINGKGDLLTRYILKLARRPTDRRPPPEAPPIAEPAHTVRPIAEPGHTDSSDRVPARALVVKQMSVKYGGVAAVTDFDLRVAPGEIVALVGPNGAGKTTVVDAISGFVAPTRGSVQLGESCLDGTSAQSRCALGLTRSFQSVEIFEDLSVRENIQVGADSRDILSYVTAFIRPSQERTLPVVAEALKLFDVAHLSDHRPEALSHAQRRLVGIVRAVATRPSVLLLDEPAAGLDETETRALAAVVRELATSWGVGVLVIEHNMDFVMGLCDRIIVMQSGRKIADGPPAEVRREPRVIEAYLGTAHEGSEKAPRRLQQLPQVGPT